MTRARKGSLSISFASGFVQDRNVVRVIASIDVLRGHDEPDCWLLMKWVRAEDQWLHFSLEWSATRLWVVEQPDLLVLATGPEGRVALLTRTGNSEEIIDSSREGPRARGPIRDLRGIGKHLYACGMGRQVYRRDRPGKWVRADRGTVLPTGSATVAGFNAMDGLSEQDLYAVGYGGEVWRCVKGKWRQLDSPTKVMLNRVRVVKKDLVYACGQRGVLLRGTGDSFETIAHGATRDALWGMEWFKGRLYVSSDDAIYQLTGRTSLQALKLGKIATCGHLHANDGVLVSFGSKHLARSEDGERWQDFTPAIRK
jgi:hypothetical protein